MPTSVTFYEQELNIDHLIADVRLQYGDLTGDTFSDTIIRTAIVNAVKFLQTRWASKYQVFHEDIVIDPQPSNVTSGYVSANTADGVAEIPDNLVNGDIYRSPHIIFNQSSPPLIEQVDEQGIILAAVYLLRKVNISSSATQFVSWGTEDIRFSNLGNERTSSRLLTDDLDALNLYFRKKIARPQKQDFAILQ